MPHRLKDFVAVIGVSALLISGGLSACAPKPDIETEAAADAASIAGSMTGERLTEIVKTIDADAVVNGNSVTFTVRDRGLIFVFDSAAGRMRIITPIVPVGGMDPAMWKRLSQANFDAVLDARYAVANDRVWAVFIHPLGSLTEADFVSGLAQTVIAAETFGTTYSSGAIIFGGGDSPAIYDDLLKALQKAAKPPGKDI